MKVIIIIFFLLFFFICIFYFVYFMPIFIYKIKAKKRGVFIDNQEAKRLIQLGCVQNIFLDFVFELRQNDLEIDIVKLAEYYLAGGKLEKLKNALLFVREKKIDISFDQLCILSLTQEDVLNLLKKGEPYF